MTLRVLCDVDVGIDDALALFYLAASPGVDIAAVGSVHGNVDARRAATNALRILEQAGLTGIPVAQGAAEPLGQPLRTSWNVHGGDGLGNTSPPLPSGSVTGESASDQIVRLGLESPGELDLLAVGPMTNLAVALEKDRHALDRFRSVVIMGGSGCEVAGWGDLTVDANIDLDPDAADLVFRIAKNIVMLGVNMEPYLILDEVRLRHLEKANQPHSDFVWAMLQHYIGFVESGIGRRVVTLWDPLAAAVLVDQTLIDSIEERPVDVVPSAKGFRAVGLENRRAAGRFDNRPPVTIVTAVDSDRMIDDVVAKLVGPMPGSRGDR